jgi:hypothetical protein
VRNLIRDGTAERVAMDISCHKTRAVFDRYNIVSKTDLIEAARRIESRQQHSGSFGQHLGNIEQKSEQPASLSAPPKFN